MEVVTDRTHINWAAWTSLDSGVVSFTRDWREKAAPKLWWGEDRLQLKSLRRCVPEQFGLQGGYFGRDGYLRFVLPESLIEEFEEDESFYVAGSFNGWEDAIGDTDWELSTGRVLSQPCRVLTIRAADFQHVENATFKFVSGSGTWIDVPDNARNTHVDKMGIKNYLFSSERSGRHLFRFKTPLPLNQGEGRRLFVEMKGTVESIRLNPGVFLKSIDAEGPFGAVVEGETTLFRLFAPRARSVSLYLFDDQDGPEGEPVEMELSDDQVWEVRVEGNLHGWFYHYTVTGQEVEEAGYFDPDFRIMDPYAKAVIGPLGPGIVVDDDYFESDPVPYTPPHWHDLVIAEAHLRDLTANAPLPLTKEERMGYRGLNKWVESEAFYLKSLGVNAVELQPIHEFDTVDREQYAWGYMPVNYFAPASQYCDDPARLDQIREFRETVQCFHRQDMAVLLDVVYNHVGEPNYLQYLDKDYYFLLQEDGHYENHSGCGNTLDANTPMVRRLIRDSLVHWIKAFDVDGFRFDLGELIGKETLSWLEGELKKVKPGVILIAEPWSFRGHIGKQLRSTGFSSWNDGYREFARRYLTHHADSREVAYYMQGSAPDWSRFPAQTVNYVASHDDRCWIDKITENTHHDGHRPTATDRRRTHMMAGMMMMSVGIPMLASGADMMKSKGGTNNTYLQGDLNAIPYNRMAEYSGTVDYFRRWITFRKSALGRLVRLDAHPGSGYFMTSRGDYAFGMVYNADYSQGNERLLFVMNPGYESSRLVFEGMELGDFSQIADTERWDLNGLVDPAFAIEEDGIVIPPLSCGLFVEGR